MYTDYQKEHLLAAAHAVDVLVGGIPSEVADYPLPSFNEDMSAALSGDPLVPFDVKHVLRAMYDWSVIAVNRWSRMQS